MSDGMTEECIEKFCYEAKVAEVKNGFVVKVGCRTFVATDKDLPMLMDYFTKKQVPAKLKKVVSAAGAFRTSDAEDEECTKEAYKEAGPGIPSFLRKNCGVNVLRVANGWVVMADGEAYIAKTKEEMVKLITA